MVDKLKFELQPASLSSGETSTLKLTLTHYHEAPLHNFSMRVRSSGEVQVMGGARLQFAQLEPNETHLVDLPLKGKQPGTGDIHLDRLSARLGGRTLDFPEVTIPLEVLLPGGFPVQALSLLCDSAPLQQNVQTNLHLRLRNDSTISLEQIELHPHIEDMQIPSEAYIPLGDIAPSQEVGVKLPVKPREAGDLTLVVHLNGRASDQLVQHDFELGFTVKPDTRAQESHTHIHGDVLQVGKGHVIGNITSSDLNQSLEKGTAIRAAGGVKPSNRSIEKIERSCPTCGEKVPSGGFCDRCGHDLESEE